MTSRVEFDSEIGASFIRYAHMVARRGYVHNTLGNMVVRKLHPDFEYGVAYTKHAEISLEEMSLDNIVITDKPVAVWRGDDKCRPQPQPRRLRPDINAVIHVHDDETIAYFGSGAISSLNRLLPLRAPASGIAARTR